MYGAQTFYVRVKPLTDDEVIDEITAEREEQCARMMLTYETLLENGKFAKAAKLMTEIKEIEETLSEKGALNKGYDEYAELLRKHDDLYESGQFKEAAEVQKAIDIIEEKLKREELEQAQNEGEM